MGAAIAWLAMCVSSALSPRKAYGRGLIQHGEMSSAQMCLLDVMRVCRTLYITIYCKCTLPSPADGERSDLFVGTTEIAYCRILSSQPTRASTSR